jgi:hypothetical protein
MKIRISFDNGTVMQLENVKTFGFDAEDGQVEKETDLPKFIKNKIEVSDNN